MANLTMLEDDWGAKGAQMTGAQVQQIIKDALRQCAQWATEPEMAQDEEAEYIVVNVDGVPKKISIQTFKEMIIQSDEMKDIVINSDELKEAILQSDELKEMLVQPEEIKDMVLQSDELKEMIVQPDEVKDMVLQSNELKEMIEQSVQPEESIGQEFINELFGLSE